MSQGEPPAGTPRRHTPGTESDRNRGAESGRSRGPAYTLALGAWLLACLALLVWFFKSDAPDVHVAFGVGLAALTFPVGLLVMWAWGAVLWLLHTGFGLDPPRGATVVLWLLTVSAGYWQWFRLVPRLARSWRRRSD